MSIKKLLILSAAGLAAVTSTAAFAGGPDKMDSQSLFAPAIYADVGGGYSFYDWPTLISNNTGTVWFNQGNMKSNDKGGYIGGVDVGLQIFKNIAVEAGGFYLPTVRGVANSSNNVTTPSCSRGTSSTSGTCVIGTQHNWAVYGAGRFNVHIPYAEGLDFFTKVGVVWRAMSNEDMIPAGNPGMRSYWDVIYGAGFAYEIAQSGFGVNLQWMHIPGHRTGSNNGTGGANGTGEDDASNHRQLATTQPVQNLLTFGVGYKFAF